MQILLSIFSAFLHPLRDFILKSEKEHRDALYILMLSFWCFYGLILTLAFQDSFFISQETLIFCTISAFGNLIYFASIARALKDGEFSILYPITRSTPFFIALFKWLFFGATYKALFLFGVFLVVYGVASIQAGFFFWNNISELKRNKKNILYALCALIGGVIYYVADDRVMSLGQISPNAYLFYNFGLCALMFLFAIAFKGGVKKEFHNLFTIIKTNWFKPALAGLTGFLSYLCVMYALHMGENVVLVSSLRLWGIPFAAILGILFLKEKSNLQRKVIAVIIILIGSLIATLNK